MTHSTIHTHTRPPTQCSTHISHTHILTFFTVQFHELFISAKHSRFLTCSKTDSFCLKLLLWNVEYGDIDQAMESKGNVLKKTLLLQFLSLNSPCLSRIKYFDKFAFGPWSLKLFIKSPPVPACPSSLKKNNCSDNI